MSSSSSLRRERSVQCSRSRSVMTCSLPPHLTRSRPCARRYGAPMSKGSKPCYSANRGGGGFWPGCAQSPALQANSTPLQMNLAGVVTIHGPSANHLSKPADNQVQLSAKLSRRILVPVKKIERSLHELQGLTLIRVTRRHAAHLAHRFLPAIMTAPQAARNRRSRSHLYQCQQLGQCDPHKPRNVRFRPGRLGTAHSHHIGRLLEHSRGEERLVMCHDPWHRAFPGWQEVYR